MDDGVVEAVARAIAAAGNMHEDWVLFKDEAEAAIAAYIAEFYPGSGGGGGR